MSEAISFRDTIVIRSRPDTLFRLALDPRRREKWDPSFAKAAFVGEEKLGNGAQVRFKLPARLLGLSFVARYGNYQAPTRGGWESVAPFGPVEKYAQAWSFKPIPGGTEVTLTTKASVRYRFVAKPVERVMRQMSGQALLELQRQVDRQGAQLMEDTAREYQQQQRDAQKAAKAARSRKR
ncbi:SRPBCC family protein [Deinococcus aquiradiocola]|uniref:Oligoketide cyclase n=1 Tax=Deinococcus aquiradiocola TaxID=393059 RepID=A0A917P5I4_9DEIO|nr:SRPBCC family protein [Deinococcus aquiradiocola]GGJ62775.1 oligoketide cyclase [Deinococcus aquiradiocola]